MVISSVAELLMHTDYAERSPSYDNRTEYANHMVITEARSHKFYHVSDKVKHKTTMASVFVYIIKDTYYTNKRVFVTSPSMHAPKSTELNVPTTKCLVCICASNSSCKINTGLVCQPLDRHVNDMVSKMLRARQQAL